MGVAGSLRLGEVNQTYSDGMLRVYTTLSARNPGPFDVYGEVTASLRSEGGVSVGVNTTKILIGVGSESESIPVEVMMDLSQLTEGEEGGNEGAAFLAFNPDRFTLEVSARLGMAPVISVDAVVKAKVEWLPPVHNLTFGTPLIENVNSGEITVLVPVSFENLSPYLPVNGMGKIDVFDSQDRLVGRGFVFLSVEPGMKWSKLISVAVSPPDDIKGLMFNETVLRYTADVDVDLTDLDMTVEGFERDFEFEWLPPVHNLTIGSPIIEGMTPTEVTLLVPASFENLSQYLSVKGVGLIRLFDPQDKLVGSGSINILAEPGECWSNSTRIHLSLPGDLAGLILNDTVLRYRAEADVTLTDLNVKVEGFESELELEWGALVKDIVTTTGFAPLNMTHTMVSAELKFKNNNHFLSLEGAVTPMIMKSGSIVYSGESTPLYVQAGSLGTISFEMPLPNSLLLSGGEISLLVRVETECGDFDLEAGTIG